VGNFINGELWGRVTDVPWAMIYPHVDSQARHPNQIYQIVGEGIIFFLLLWWYSSKPRPRMAVSGFFLLGYGIYRFLVEFVREPDNHLGFVALDWLTMGQILSLPMILLGILFMVVGYKNADKNREKELIMSEKNKPSEKNKSGKKSKGTKNKKNKKGSGA